ncbi:MAG TPA: class I SAM-dependent methyltransferase [Gammaproteobacteria bacterium]|nr:class I SAM-dependent methyltransferase [Gammaproteobacteria bacterium]
MKTNWLSTLFITLTEFSYRLKQTLWHWVYNKIARRDVSGKFVFMNYGYDNKTDTPLILKQQDEPYRYFIQLYNHVVKDIDLKNKAIIEVGCGRGGGGNFLLQYKNPSSYIGIDLSEAAIIWCKNQFKFTNSQWMQGSADALPTPNNSVDIVINVESSHCYPSMEKFLQEVKRVLKPNGYMAFCDLRSASEIAKLESHIAASGLVVINQSEITSQVLQALDKVSSTREAEIMSVFPTLFHRAVRDFAGVKDTAVYNMLKAGEMKYLCYLLQK